MRGEVCEISGRREEGKVTFGAREAMLDEKSGRFGGDVDLNAKARGRALDAVL